MEGLRCSGHSCVGGDGREASGHIGSVGGEGTFGGRGSGGSHIDSRDGGGGQDVHVGSRGGEGASGHIGRVGGDGGDEQYVST